MADVQAERVPLQARIARWCGLRLRVPKCGNLPFLIYPPDSGRARVRARTRLRNGEIFCVDTRSYVEWRLWVYGEYEPDVQAVMRRYTRPGNTVVDVGANIGTHTVPMSEAVGPDGLVLAVEPLPAARERLARNLALNGVTNVRVIPQAASDRNGKGLLHAPPRRGSNQAQASLAPLHHLATAGTIEVPLVTLDTLIAEQHIDRARLIKIDVEGHEREVLTGATNLIDRCHPVLIFEYSPAHIAELA